MATQQVRQGAVPRLTINLKDIPKNLYTAALVVVISVVGFYFPIIYKKLLGQTFIAKGSHHSVSSGGATSPFSFIVA